MHARFRTVLLTLASRVSSSIHFPTSINIVYFLFRVNLSYVLVQIFNIQYKGMPIPVAARSQAYALIAWALRSWVRIPPKAWMFVLCR
jgi:hypothetical protein